MTAWSHFEYLRSAGLSFRRAILSVRGFALVAVATLLAWAVSTLILAMLPVAARTRETWQSGPSGEVPPYYGRSSGNLQSAWRFMICDRRNPEYAPEIEKWSFEAQFTGDHNLMAPVAYFTANDLVDQLKAVCDRHGSIEGAAIGWPSPWLMIVTAVTDTNDGHLARYSSEPFSQRPALDQWRASDYSRFGVRPSAAAVGLACHLGIVLAVGAFIVLLRHDVGWRRRTICGRNCTGREYTRKQLGRSHLAYLRSAGFAFRRAILSFRSVALVAVATLLAWAVSTLILAMLPVAARTLETWRQGPCNGSGPYQGRSSGDLQFACRFMVWRDRRHPEYTPETEKWGFEAQFTGDHDQMTPVPYFNSDDFFGQLKAACDQHGAIEGAAIGWPRPWLLIVTAITNSNLGHGLNFYNEPYSQRPVLEQLQASEYSRFGVRPWAAAVGLACHLGIVLTVGAFVVLLRHDVRWRRQIIRGCGGRNCPGCGYSREGLMAEYCPECGAAL